MLEMKLEKIDDNSACLNVGGDMTIMNIASLYAKVKELIAEFENLTIGINEDTQIDITFIQLICSAHRAFTLADKKFQIKGDIASLFAKTDEAGYTRHKGCEFDKFCSCVLVKRED